MKNCCGSPRHILKTCNFSCECPMFIITCLLTYSIFQFSCLSLFICHHWHSQGPPSFRVMGFLKIRYVVWEWGWVVIWNQGECWCQPPFLDSWLCQCHVMCSNKDKTIDRFGLCPEWYFTRTFRPYFKIFYQLVISIDECYLSAKGEKPKNLVA